jgi:hypothetical protein
MSYLCGKSLERITSQTDLISNERENLNIIIKSLTQINPLMRISLEEAMQRIRSIGNDDYIHRGSIEFYVQGLKK